MADPTLAQQRQLEYLLADFQSLKAEIARRGSLQRVVLGAYITFAVLVIQYVLTSEHWAGPLAGLWLGSCLALLFHEREHLEICKLAERIRSFIAAPAAQLLGVEPSALLPSEVAQVSFSTDGRTRAYDRLFFWVAFLLVPAASSAGAAWARWQLVASGNMKPYTCPAAWVAALAAVIIVYLLSRH